MAGNNFFLILLTLVTLLTSGGEEKGGGALIRPEMEPDGGERLGGKFLISRLVRQALLGLASDWSGTEA